MDGRDKYIVQLEQEGLEYGAITSIQGIAFQSIDGKVHGFIDK